MYEKKHKIPTNNIFTGKTVHILSINTEEFVKREICHAVELTRGISDAQLGKEFDDTWHLCTLQTLKKYCKDLVKEKKIKCDESGKNIQWIPITSKTFEELRSDLKKMTKSIAESADKIKEKFKDQSDESQIELHELLNEISDVLKSYANQKMTETRFLRDYKLDTIKSNVVRTASKVEENYSDDLYDKIYPCLSFLWKECDSLIRDLADHNSKYTTLRKSKKRNAIEKEIYICEKSLSSYREDLLTICRNVDHGREYDELQKLYEKLEKKYPKQWSL